MAPGNGCVVTVSPSPLSSIFGFFVTLLQKSVCMSIEVAMGYIVGSSRITPFRLSRLMTSRASPESDESDWKGKLDGKSMPPENGNPGETVTPSED